MLLKFASSSRETEKYLGDKKFPFRFTLASNRSLKWDCIFKTSISNFQKFISNSFYILQKTADTYNFSLIRFVQYKILRGQWVIFRIKHWFFFCRLYYVFILNRVMRSNDLTQTAFTCSKLTTDTLEQGVKYVQS